MSNITVHPLLSGAAPDPDAAPRYTVDAGDFTGIARLFCEHELLGMSFGQAQCSYLVRGKKESAIWLWSDRWIAERHWYRGQPSVRPFHPTRYKVREIAAALAVIPHRRFAEVDRDLIDREAVARVHAREAPGQPYRIGH